MQAELAGAIRMGEQPPGTLHNQEAPAKIGAQNTEKGRKMPPEAVNHQAPCPCGSHKTLGSCCLRLILGQLKAPTAESLMRSRYTAHCLVAVDYLWDTWSAEQRVRSRKSDIKAWAESCEWLGLQILATQGGGETEDSGLVEFVASYRQQGQIHHHHEVSLFTKTLGQWFYVDHASE
mgnify:CR=1 FL=1